MDTIIDIEAIVQMWRAGLISEDQAIADIKVQLEIHEEIVAEHGRREKENSTEF